MRNVSGVIHFLNIPEAFPCDSIFLGRVSNKLRIKYMRILLSLLLMFSSCFCWAGERNKTMTIIHTNDTHCRVSEDKNAIGFARIKTLVDTIKTINRNVLVVDGGDFIQGKLICSMDKGDTIVNIMNEVGYDAAVIGNHEFIYGQSRLQTLMKKLNYPLLAANVKYDNGQDFTRNFIIKDIDGIKVGIFGVSTQTITARPENIAGVKLLDPVAIAKEMVQSLQAEKVDVIIALSHLGLNKADRNHSQKLAEEVAGIDVIIDGHSHTALEKGQVVNDVLIAQTGHRTHNLGIVNLEFVDGKLNHKQAALINHQLASLVKKDQSIDKIVQQANARIDTAYSEVIGNASEKLNGDRYDVRSRETNLGNMLSDMIREKAGTDTAIIFAPLISASMGPGEITKKDLVNILTEDFDIVKVEIKGADLLTLLEAGLKTYFQQVSGIRFSYDSTRPLNKRIVGDVLINENVIDKNKNYTLALVDWHYEESKHADSLYHIIQQARYIESVGSMNALFENYVRQHSPLRYHEDGRVTKLR